jgi:Ca2+-binding EF-hand superfamily protein
VSKSEEEIRETFEHFDRDGNGAIDVAEFAALLAALGASAGAEELAAGLEALDSNRNGRIDFDEFAAWWGAR